MDIFEEVEVKCEPVSRFDDEDIDDLNDPVQTSPIKQENSVSIFESETGDFDATFVEILNVSNIDIKPAAKLKPAKKVSKTQDPSKAPYVLPTNHSCFICDLKFFSNQKKNEHIFQVHEKESAYACTICSYVLETAKLLDTHMRMHKIQPNVFCESCGKAFFNVSNLFTAFL